MPRQIVILAFFIAIIAVSIVIAVYLRRAKSAAAFRAAADSSIGMPPARKASTRSSTAPAAASSKESIRSIVLLLKAPRKLDESRLAVAAEEAFGFPFNGEDHFVKAMPRPGFFGLHTPTLDLGIMNIETPYFNNAAEVADSLRLFSAKTAVQNHKAWIAIDLIGKTRLSDSDVYAAIGKLAAELLAPDVLAVLCTSNQKIVPVDKRTAGVLRSGAPLALFDLPPEDPIVMAKGNDAALATAAEEAKERWPEFVAAFKLKKSQQGFAIKMQFNEGDTIEHMWVEVTSIDGNQIRGTLANKPDLLHNIKEAAPVSTTVDQIEDWIYSGGDQMVGGFSIKVLKGK